MAPLSLTSGLSRLSVVLALMAGVLFSAHPALSQNYQPREQGRQEQFSERPSPNLPEWAKPSESPSSETDRRTPSSNSLSGTMSTKDAPALPSPAPTQVPVDGGVALLAAAGAGYAVRKLSEEDEDEDDEPA